MRSKIAQAVNLRHPPLGIYRSKDPAPGAKQFARMTKFSPSQTCSMPLLEQAFRDSVPCSFSTETVRCVGAFHGFGLSPPAWKMPGGPMAALRLVSSGNLNCEEGRAAVEALRSLGASAETIRMYSEGEGLKRDPEILARSFATMPRIPPIEGHLNYVPLDRLEEAPEAVVFLADSQQLSALITLAGYARPSNDNVSVPFCSACMSVSIFPLAEIESEAPRATVGLTDVSVRKIIRRLVGRDLLSFAVPWGMYEEMEGNVEGSFLERGFWRSIA
jgi:hypothetical protein